MNERDGKNAGGASSRWGSIGSSSLPEGAAAPAGVGHRATLYTTRWISWIVAAAMTAAVIMVALHFSEEEELLRIAERAEPWWLAVAVVLQAGTYLSQGEIWCTVMRAAGIKMPLPEAFKLSLAKLFVDQALPSGGMSGTVVVARALEERGVPRNIAMASLVVDIVAYYAAAVFALALALVILVAGGHANLLILSAALFFVIFSVALAATVLAVARRQSADPGKLGRSTFIGKVMALLRETDSALVRQLPLIAKSSLLQFAVVLLDTTTIWVFIRSLGERPSPTGVFASFMVSTLFRTISIVPGGLGVFEAASVMSLKLVGVSVPVALASTLLFRGISFWLPMVPGLFFSRGVRKGLPPRTTAVNPNDGSWWSTDIGQVAQESGSSLNGLTGTEAAARLQQYGNNGLVGEKSASRIAPLLWRQISSPVVVILIAAAILSFAMHDDTDGDIILLIVFTSALLGFWQEFRAATAVAGLQKMVAVKADVLRDGAITQVALAEVVPGDVFLLAAGSSIPGDSRIIEARDLFVNQATLTGETFPVEKMPGDLPADTPLAQRSNAVFLGTHVVSGVGRALVVRTGRDTQFGAIADRLRIRPEETDFERGVRQFGMLLIRVTLVLVILIFALNVYLHRPVLDSFLFALALAVGLTPELLPAIISVNLASGARRMAARKVIVKRLVSIENFGSMNVLCSDKTGTLTEGKVKLDGTLDAEGRPSVRALTLAGVNAAFQSGFNNPIDAAIVAAAGQPAAGIIRLDELPYDFARKRLSVLTAMEAQTVMITKGALAEVLSVCTEVEVRSGEVEPIEDHLQAIQAQYAAFSASGVRTIGLAIRSLPARTAMTHEDEAGMTFVGFLLFADPPKEGIKATIEELGILGIELKIITGDNPLVAQALAAQIGLTGAKIVSGPALSRVSDDALPRLAHVTDIFAEVEPNQKERIIRALRKAGNVVGYMGDGINDAPALYAADVGLSVQGASDVAKQAADIVLLEQDLAVLADGVREGRRTFANTQKYVFMATSANFGNMFSMAGASLLLPFLPLLPKQILLTNLMTDLPEMTIATDRVDTSSVQRPQRWDVRFIRRFMFRFGLLSSVFDFLTFTVLYFVLRASPELFRSGWFVESVVSAAMVVLVLRTRGAFWLSRPSRALTLATLAVVIAAIAFPYTPLGAAFGFAPLPWLFLSLMGVVVLGYIGSAELLKRSFANSRGAAP